MQCPSCGGERIWKDGIRYVRRGLVQRYLCRSCGYRFSEPNVKVNVAGKIFEQFNSGKNFSKANIFAGDFSFKPSLNDLPFEGRENIRSHRQSNVIVAEKRLNIFRDYNRDCRVCASEREVKNLVTVGSRIEKRAAGATELNQAEIKGKLVEYLWFLKKRGYTKSTVKTKVQTLKRLVRMGVNLLNPESVKDVLAAHDEWSNNYKKIVVYAYDNFTEMLKISWKPPICKPLGKLPFVPLEKEVDALIAGCSKKVATSLQLMKETGMRIGEVWSLEWTDIDDKRHTIRCQSEKYGNPRMFKVSGKLLAMLNALPKRSEKVFDTGLKTHRASFNIQRKRLAQKLHNPRLLKISFHTLRHWKATMEYHHTKDILHVKQLLGHRSINSTMIYTHLINFEGDEFTCKTAKTIDEAKGLIEAGFDYVTDMNSYKLFRKRK
jgi:integrase